jgi:hypothetical protein
MRRLNVLTRRTAAQQAAAIYAAVQHRHHARIPPTQETSWP